MCGIWISVGFDPEPERLDMVAHRGPDGRGWRVAESDCGPVALGHRRLSIIDTSDAALQPMADASGRYWLVFNGEIYNFLELRREIEAAGHSFRTRSDSEVLLLGYALWGEAVLDRLVGMFAFAIWDEREQCLFVARDRFGIKPLYMVANERGIAFASEIKQLLRLPGESGRANHARLRDFLFHGISNHTAETMFADVRQIRGGECATLDLRHWRPADPVPVRRWYGVLKPGTVQLGEAEAAERFRDLFAESVRLHLRSDVTIGSCLSGGLDSSSIVRMADRLLAASTGAGTGAGFATFTACYDDPSVDERRFADAVVEGTRCVPHHVHPRVEDAVALAEKITWHQDEPYGSTSIFAQWSVFEAAKHAGVKVMLDGQGADEQLAGYHGGFGYYHAGLLRNGRLLALGRSLAERRARGASLPGQAKAMLLPLMPMAMAEGLRRKRQAVTGHDWFGGEALRDADGAAGAHQVALDALEMGPIRGVGDLCVAMTQGFNLAMLLHWEDRNSMAHGIEARVPFLDHRLVEFSIGLGDRHKMVLADTKRVLRRAMGDLLPPSVAGRRDKLGFATPEAAWFRGPLRPAILDGIEETLTRYPGLFNAAGVRRLAADMLDGRRPLDFTLWRIVNVGVWGRVFGVTL